MRTSELRSKMMAAATTTCTTTTITRDKILMTKIENAVGGLPLQCINYLSNEVLPTSKENALTICDYISALKSDTNPSDRYRADIIILLSKFLIFLKNTKLFVEVTREELLSFLDSFHKIESIDPLHKWVGIYNLYRIHLMRFFKWLYYPKIEYKLRPKPGVIENIHQLKRNEKSIYRPTDLWTPVDDSLFLKYCSNTRDRC
jgi:hypothetical protein